MSMQMLNDAVAKLSDIHNRIRDLPTLVSNLNALGVELNKDHDVLTSLIKGIQGGAPVDIGPIVQGIKDVKGILNSIASLQNDLLKKLTGLPGEISIGGEDMKPEDIKKITDAINTVGLNLINTLVAQIKELKLSIDALKAEINKPLVITMTGQGKK